MWPFGKSKKEKMWDELKKTDKERADDRYKELMNKIGDSVLNGESDNPEIEEAMKEATLIKMRQILNETR